MGSWESRPPRSSICPLSEKEQKQRSHNSITNIMLNIIGLHWSQRSLLLSLSLPRCKLIGLHCSDASIIIYVNFFLNQFYSPSLRQLPRNFATRCSFMDIRTNAIRILTARCTLVQSAVRIAIACRLSVCLSVRDVDGSGSHRLKNLETNCTDNQSNTFALRRPKVIHQLPEEHGWEKWRSWSTKAAISLKRVQIEETLLWGTYRNSPTLYPTVPFPTPLWPPLPQDCGLQPLPKTPIAIISGTAGKTTNFKFDQNNSRVHLNKSILKK